MNPDWKPYREPMLVTVLRTGGIALVVGALLARGMGGLSRWPLASLLVLWVSLGGHWVELLFLNGIRPRLPAARPAQVAARLTVWFVGGAVLGLGMGLTAWTLAGLGPARWPAAWLAGAGFVGLELLVHGVLQLSGRPSFYTGRG